MRVLRARGDATQRAGGDAALGLRRRAGAPQNIVGRTADSPVWEPPQRQETRSPSCRRSRRQPPVQPLVLRCGQLVRAPTSDTNDSVGEARGADLALRLVLPVQHAAWRREERDCWSNFLQTLTLKLKAAAGNHLGVISKQQTAFSS
jgi:hypothetical protein